MASNKGKGKTAKVAGAPGAEKAQRGPLLVWNAERDAALVKAARSGINTQDGLCDALGEHAAFTGLEAGALSPFKVAFRLRALRAAGVTLPFERLGRERYTPNAEVLNAV